ncbi:hypothetical protein PENSPDRAFT_652766 [Peniophora sp. CONT]|nr:hypothetical protein PENSPDRAFT_652766 [Peniophora sp. CONT]
MEVDQPVNVTMGVTSDEATLGNTPDTVGDDSDHYMTADEGADAADAFDIGSSPEHEDFTDYLETILDHILQNSNADIALAHHDDLGRLPPNDPSSKPRIIVADGVAMFHRRDVARSPSLETPAEEASTSDPLNTDESGTVAMIDDDTSTTGMVSGPSTSASNGA